MLIDTYNSRVLFQIVWSPTSMFKLGNLEQIVDAEMYEIFKKESQKWPIQDLSTIKRNKIMKNQPIQGIP